MSTLLRDVIEIPERVSAEDYVLRLTDGVGPEHVAATMASYVVTDAIAEAFDSALALVDNAITTGTSRGAFLAGSFGSGKSHFMAVLHALLGHEPAARAEPMLQPVIARHDPTLDGKNVLRLAYHLLGAKTLEDAILGGYLRQVRALHPDAPLPAVHQSDSLLRDADNLRGGMGDDAFFAKLNGDSADGADGAADGTDAAVADPWGDLLGSGIWNAETYAAAEAASPESESRQQLVTALVQAFFSSYTTQAEFVDLDTGLAAISRHAKALGYDAVVLFLDELVLWLAFSVQDQSFFARESQKITKLVESGSGNRPIPLVSFIARQMDLAEWFADAGASGAEQEALERAFRHQAGRFSTIELGDDNLPYVANKRLLVPRDADGKAALQAAFDRLDRRADVWDVLLDGINTDDKHRGTDEAAFRLTYPFSPALISTLRSLAGVMQRERTALKVMQQMLVDRRESLTTDDIIPVGDSFNYVVDGQEPLDHAAASRFRAARALYSEKLLPAIRSKYGVSAEQAAGAPAGESTVELPRGFRADDRLAKTLLLSAVAQNVPALKELTPARLASLNHGSIAAPVAGAEAAVVLSTVKDWQRKIPEIRVGGDARNPVIHIQLADVDYESVVTHARAEDNFGRRQELIKQLVRESFGITETGQDMFGAIAHQLAWRGSSREVDVLFGNVRDAGWLSEEHFRSRPGAWRFVIDYPFDDANHTIADDFERVDALRAGGLQTHTVVWLPRFLSAERQAELGRLVIIDHILSSDERWRSHADHLSETDRVTARSILESQRGALFDQLRFVIQAAYGAAAPVAGDLLIDEAHEKLLVSFDDAFSPQPPVGATLADAFDALADAALTSQYPAHPTFEPAGEPIVVRELTWLQEALEAAAADPEGRVPVEPSRRTSIRRIAGALRVGRMTETHFLFGDDQFAFWNKEFAQHMTRDDLAAGDNVTVRQARDWIAAVAPAMGLRSEVADLVILAWVSLRGRAWYQHGAPIAALKPGGLRDDMELRREPTPPKEQWETAIVRSGAIFGLAANPYLTPTNVAELTERLQSACAGMQSGAHTAAQRIEEAYTRLGISTDEATGSLGTGRLATARASAELLDTMTRSSDRLALVRVLAETQLPATDEAIAKSLSSSAAVVTALDGFRWERLESVRAAARSRRGGSGGDGGSGVASGGGSSPEAQAATIMERLKTAVTSDEIAQTLGAALRDTDDDVFAWAQSRVTLPPPLPPKPPSRRTDPDSGAGGSGSIRLSRGAPASEIVEPLNKFLRDHADRDVEVTWQAVE